MRLGWAQHREIYKNLQGENDIKARLDRLTLHKVQATAAQTLEVVSRFVQHTFNVEELVNSQIPNLQICVTSRPEADIVPVLEPLAFRSVQEWASGGHCRICQVCDSQNCEMRWKATDKTNLFCAWCISWFFRAGCHLKRDLRTGSQCNRSAPPSLATIRPWKPSTHVMGQQNV